MSDCKRTKWVKVDAVTFTLPSPTFTFKIALRDTYYTFLEHHKFLFSQNTMVKVGEGRAFYFHSLNLLRLSIISTEGEG